jgi:phosphoenolpyruvate phosphomutase
MKVTKQLNNIIQANELDFFLEAHNGLSAKIVSEAGFKGIWASGLSISASCGARDRNEISWTEVLDIVERMVNVVDIPILLDGDSGFGDFNNVRCLIKRAERRGVAGICIEDKIFPKTNSFLEGKNQKLVSTREFCGKIMAAKDTQVDHDFCVIARTESLIMGQSVAESIDRCSAYAEAGANAILIHSKKNDADQIQEFSQKWGKRCPVVIVPTTYQNTPTEKFKEMEISLVLWANHLIRSSIRYMQEIADSIMKNQNVYCIDSKIAPLSEVFRLQNTAELEAAEAKYY